MSTTVTIHGKVTRKPDIARTTSGQEICTITVSVNRPLPPKGSDAPKEITSYFNVKAFGALARNAERSLVKGTQVVITGRLDQRSWETTRGETRTMLEIVADDIAASLRFTSVGAERTPTTTPPVIVAPPLPTLAIVGGRR